MVAALADTQKTYSILIADDDDAWRETLGEVLDNEGFRTHLASCGEEAIEIVRRESLHLAMLDLHMPRLDGMATLRAIRKINRPLPCILVTAQPEEADANALRCLHVSTVISKEVGKSGIITTVTRIIAAHYS
ncbi:MAG: response regulator [Planctomycetia bacterium]|nr:response regulator [Planctomycetia bacterium]